MEFEIGLLSGALVSTFPSLVPPLSIVKMSKYISAASLFLVATPGADTSPQSIWKHTYRVRPIAILRSCFVADSYWTPSEEIAWEKKIIVFKNSIPFAKIFIFIIRVCLCHKVYKGSWIKWWRPVIFNNSYLIIFCHSWENTNSANSVTSVFPPDSVFLNKIVSTYNFLSVFISSSSFVSMAMVVSSTLSHFHKTALTPTLTGSLINLHHWKSCCFINPFTSIGN